MRRKRYRCGRNFVRLVDIEPLPVYATRFPQFADLHTRVEAPPVEQAVLTPAVQTEAAAPPVEAAPAAQAEPVVTAPAPVSPPAEVSSTTSSTDAPESDKTDAPSEEVKPTPAEETKPAEPAPAPAPEPVPEPWPKADKIINRKISTWRGDITRLEIDAVVNAANDSLLGGGGIDGAIHNAAGGQLYRECLTLGGASTGQTKITRGYNLPAKYILHTVGPIGERPAKLIACYESCLELCALHGIKSVAFCGVSTGIYGYPLENATRVALEIVRRWAERNPEKLAKMDRIIFCTFLAKEEECYLRLIPEFFPLTADAEFMEEWRAHKSAYASEPESETPESSSSEEDDEEEEEEETPSQPAEQPKPSEAPKVEESKASEEKKAEDSDEDDEAEELSDVVFGKVLLRKGEVEVELPPSKFEQAFEDFYYTLTPVGKWAPLFIKKGLKNSRFTIACADDAVEDVLVHWTVRGEDY